MEKVKKNIAPRKKAYKNMSVSELVTAKKELSVKMQEIDAILNKAVEAVQGTVTNRNKNYVNNNTSFYDPAFGERSNNQVAISREAPVLNPINKNAPDQSSGFSIFDAEAFAQEQSKAEEEYLANNPNSVIENVDFDFNSQKIENEIESLKNNIKNSINNVQDTSTTAEGT